jgi:penicillin amidase
MQADTVSVRARGWARLLAASPPLGGDAERARALLAAWDGDLGAGSAAALLYACFRQEMARAAFAPLLDAGTWAWIAAGSDAGAETLLERWLYDLGARGDAEPAALEDALAASWQRAAAAAGTNDPRAWQWASVHRCAPRHPLSASFPEAAGTLDPPAFGLGGDNDTIRVASFSLAPAGAFAVRDVSVSRQVIDFAVPRMLWSIPGGASGEPGSPGSPHRDDQLDLWRDCRLVPAARSVEEAAHAAVETFILEVL